MRPCIRIDKNKNFAARLNVGDRNAQIVDLLPTINCFARDNDASANHLRRVFALNCLLNDAERRIVTAIGDKNNFVSGVVLIEKRGEIFAQPIVQSPAGSNYRNVRRIICGFAIKFATNLTGEIKAAA